MYKKIIGSILMILGTSVGAGMLALPIVTANETIGMSLFLLFASWIVMTIGAYSLLEVNFWLPSDANMISMADKTLGKWGKLFTWFIYLLLLYSLICAYLSGLSDILQGLLANINIHIPRWLATVTALGLFGVIVYRGIASVDIVNRLFMSVKLLAFVIIIALLSKHIHLNYLTVGDYQWRNSAFTVMLTAFGYAIIFPSIRNYLGNDIKLLKKVILIGSLLPLIIYSVWIVIIQGVITKAGDGGLINILASPNTNSMLMNSVSAVVNTQWVSNILKLFVSICAVTSFLGVSICLTDFIADGLSVKKDSTMGKNSHSPRVYLLSYLPPLVVVFASPGIFVKALDYAGIWCLILLIIIPMLMLYSGRYRLGLREPALLPYGKKFLVGSLFFVFCLLVVNVIKI